jgi:hypothetical protein
MVTGAERCMVNCCTWAVAASMVRHNAVRAVKRRRKVVVVLMVVVVVIVVVIVVIIKNIPVVFI